MLRNLDDAAELRRNPLVRGCFAARDGAVERVRTLVHASLAECRTAVRGSRRGLARMHAALLRCEIDKQPLAVVAAELGLSDRQVRRERRAAHDAFLDALTRAAADAKPRAVVRDVVQVRLARASELHELGQSTLALAACDAIAAQAPCSEHRIEALCLAAEIDCDAGRFTASSARVERAAGMLAPMDGAAPERTLAEERVDLAGWSLRRALGLTCALAMAPPLIVRRGAEPSGEARAALLTAALAAYAQQRWEVGDHGNGARAVRRAWQVVPLLGAPRMKERLAVMMADARVQGLLCARPDEQYRAAEHLAERCGHVRTRLVARAERIGEDAGSAGDPRFLDRCLDPLDAVDRRAMPWTVGAIALMASQTEREHGRRIAAAELAERLLPPRSATALLARAMRVSAELKAGAYERARVLAHAVRNDAEAAGNGRVRGAAVWQLAEIALAQRRRRDARRHLAEAQPLLERYGTCGSREAVRALAQRVDPDARCMFLSANITRAPAR